jgi:hypothetical protein
MGYSRQVNTKYPAAIFIVIDQTSPMADLLKGPGKDMARSNLAARTANKLLYEIVLRSTTDEGVRDRFYVNVIGYGSEVKPLLTSDQNPSASPDLIPISTIANQAVWGEDFSWRGPIWVTSLSVGETTDNEAWTFIKPTAQEWVQEHPWPLSLTLLHITGEEPTKGVLESTLKYVSDNEAEGRIALFKLYVPSDKVPWLQPFPRRRLSNDYARAAFNLASNLPEPMSSYVKRIAFDLPDLTRGWPEMDPLDFFTTGGTRAIDLD